MRAGICQRDDCGEAGWTYHRYGRAVSTGPWTWSSGAAIQPEPPVTLCRDHAMEWSGFAITDPAPGSP